MPSPRSLACLAALALMGLACGDSGPRATEANMARLLAESFCEEQQTCACDDFEANWGSYEGCVEIQLASWEDRQAAANELGLSFSARCVDEAIASGPDCSTPEELLSSPSQSDEVSPSCQYYYGDKEVGEACEGSPYMSDCSQGLSCLFDVCIDPVVEYGGEEAKLGEDCMNESCQSNAYCGSDFTCVERNPNGETCSLDKECMSYCCAEGLCSPGEPLVCGFGCAG